MSRLNRKRVIVTLGDSGGIGPEVVLKALLEAVPGDNTSYVLCGPMAHWEFHRDALLNLKPELAEPMAWLWKWAEWLDVPAAICKPRVGLIDAEHGRIAYDAIALGVQEILAGKAHALVTAPVSKEALHLAGIRVPGQTELLRDLCGIPETTMAFHSNKEGCRLIVALTTVHIPLRDVCNTLSVELIQTRLSHLAEFCRELGIENPRIGVCGVNPHASEGGMFGDEEAQIIAPAMQGFKAPGVLLVGPLPGDTAFFEAREGRYDAVLSMFHDQGLAAVKTVAFDSAVNVTLGMPFYRTSPDHGTAFGLAGKGVARHESMGCALRLAESLIHY